MTLRRRLLALGLLLGLVAPPVAPESVALLEDAEAVTATLVTADTFVVDTTAPTAIDVQATNGGATAGQPELGDAVTFTFSEPMSAGSILAGWSGAGTAVVVRITDGGLTGADVLTVRNAANTSLVPLGTVSLGGIGYVVSTRDFGASGTASTMAMTGSAVTVTLGTPSGTTGTEPLGTTMSWTPSAGATDVAGNPCLTTPASEQASGIADVEF